MIDINIDEIWLQNIKDICKNTILKDPSSFSLEVNKHFTGTQNKDYYEGMIIGLSFLIEQLDITTLTVYNKALIIATVSSAVEHYIKKNHYPAHTGEGRFNE